MSELIIREGKAEDAARIAEIEKLCFADPWSLKAVMDELTENPLAWYIVGEKEGVVEGYAGFHKVCDEAHITNIAVSPSERGLGYGEKIVRGLIDVAEKKGCSALTLEVRISNTVAQHLYEKIGFISCGIRPNYYSDGEGAVIMWLKKE